MDEKLKFYYFDASFLRTNYSNSDFHLKFIIMAIGIRIYDLTQLLNLQSYESDDTYIQEKLGLTEEEIDGLKELYTDIDSIIVKKLILLKHEEKIEELVDFLDKEKIEKIRNDNIIKVKWE